MNCILVVKYVGYVLIHAKITGLPTKTLNFIYVTPAFVPNKQMIIKQDSTRQMPVMLLVFCVILGLP